MSGSDAGGYAWVEERTIAELRAMLDNRDITSRELTEAYLARIQDIDTTGPALRSVIEVNPDAISIAECCDREQSHGERRGPLHGIPILIKDNIESGDRMLTTAGSLALAASSATQDGFVTRRLREAGAVILGKTNLSEWANFRSTRSSSGWSGRGGQTRNAYVLNRNPSGSSSGSGVAAAANLAAAAVGTETNGSIVSPAAANGIVGLKPTVGRVSRTGIVPISHSQDTAGPMTRTVADAAAVFTVLVGRDREDPATHSLRDSGPEDYTRFLDPSGLRAARLGIVRNVGFGSSPKADRVVEAAIEIMRGAGADVIDVELAGALDPQRHADQLTVLFYEFKHNLDRYLQRRGATSPVHNLAEVIRFNDEHAEAELSIFGQELLLQAEEKGNLDTPEYLEAFERNRRCFGADGIDALVRDHDLDALVSPTNGPAWLIDHVNGDSPSGGSSGPAAIAGYPAITVPAGFVAGLPIGISFYGPSQSEPILFKIASGFEHQCPARRRPRFLESTP